MSDPLPSLLNLTKIMEESWKDYYHPSSIQEYNPKNLFQDFPTRSKAQITPLSSLISKDHNNAQNDNILVDGSYKNILNSPYEASVNVTTCPSSLSAKNKRVFDDHHHNMIENGGDHVVDSRYKRMIKNRDSAARSRARKQVRIILSYLFYMIDSKYYFLRSLFFFTHSL